MSKRKTQAEPVEAPDLLFPFAHAIAVAQGHPNPAYFASCTVAAYTGQEMPFNPSDTPDEPAEETVEEEGTEGEDL